MFNFIHKYKINKALKSVGINTKHKTANDVLDELSNIWDTLSTNTQDKISITLAGKSSNVFKEWVIRDGARFGDKD